MSQFVLDISKIDKRDIDTIGKYAAELGELSHIGIPIPEGFVVTANCFREFIAENKLTLDSSEKQIIRLPISEEITSQINNAYKELGNAFKESKVVLALSSPFSFKNIHFEVKGDANLIHKIKEIWVSQFSKLSLLENRVNSVEDFHKLDVAIIVQKKIDSEKNGKIYTEDPLTSDKKKIVIEQDENISHYLISKQNLDTLFKGHLTKAKKAHKLSDNEAHELASLGKKIEKHFYFPQEIKFLISKNKIYILETKPMTNIAPKSSFRSEPSYPSLSDVYSHFPKVIKKHVKRDTLLKGVATFPGIATGPVRIYRSYKIIHNAIPSEIIVVPTINSQFLATIKKAKGLVTESVPFRGSDIMIYRKLFGKPLIQGAKDATKILHTGSVVTLNGEKGEIYKGGL